MTVSFRRLLFSLFLALSHSLALADELTGQVVRVLDGDTLEVLTPQKVLHRIRLIGIDAPEKKQAFGDASKRAMSDLAFSRNVVVVYNKRDRYGRIVGLVRHGAADVGLALVRRGLAWHYKKYQSEQTPLDRDGYSDAEQLARKESVGVWGDSTPIAPWDFRKRKGTVLVKAPEG